MLSIFILVYRVFFKYFFLKNNSRDNTDEKKEKTINNLNKTDIFFNNFFIYLFCDKVFLMYCCLSPKEKKS